MFFKEKELGLFDSHAHLNSTEFDKDLEDVVSRSIESDVKRIVDIAVDLVSSRKSISLAKRFPDVVYATVGIDPETQVPGSSLYTNVSDIESYMQSCFSDLFKLVEENREVVVGIGETGVDTYWIKKSAVSVSEQEVSLKKQLALLNIHIELASHFKLPLTIHSRGYESELIEVLKNRNVTGVFHSYTGNLETAKKILDSGFGLGVNGIITFKNADDLRSVYKSILGGTKIDSPNDLYSRNIFLETDAPYLSPNRGERNEPRNVSDIFKFIQENL